MNEVFAEHIIKCRLTVKEFAMRMVSIFALFTSFIAFLALGPYGVPVVALVIYLVWYIFTITNVEYEYSIVNADLVIDKIMGQRKRKRVAEFDFKKAEIMAYIDSEHLKQYEQRAVKKDYSAYTNSKKRIGVVFVDGPDTTELIFEPNKKIVEAIRKIRPGIIKLD